MKKTFVLIMMIMLATASMAQQGSWYIGGLVGYHSSTEEDAAGIKTVTSSWDFSPEFGTFLRDDIQLGIALGLGGEKIKVDGDDDSKTSAIDPIVYGRKFFKLTDNFSTFAGLYLRVISEKTTDYGPTSESTASGFGVTLGAGIAYALSPRFTAVGQYGVLGFESRKNKQDGTETSTVKDFDFGVETVGVGSVFNIGLYYTFKQ